MKAIIVCCLLLSLGFVHGADQETAPDAAKEPTPDAVKEPAPDAVKEPAAIVAPKEVDTPAPIKAGSTIFRVVDPETNATCILAQFGGKVSWKVDNENSTTLDLTNAVVDSQASKCQPAEQVLAITAADSFQKLSFTFTRNESKIELVSIDATLGSKDKLESFKAETSFEFAAKKTFKCDAGLKVDLLAENKTANLALTKVRFDAFREKDVTDDFEPDQTCSDDVQSKTNKTVPMIIALILTAMIVTILVIYVILRRRQSNSQYQSP